VSTGRKLERGRKGTAYCNKKTDAGADVLGVPKCSRRAERIPYDRAISPSFLQLRQTSREIQTTLQVSLSRVNPNFLQISCTSFPTLHKEDVQLTSHSPPELYATFKFRFEWTLIQTVIRSSHSGANFSVFVWIPLNFM